MTSCTKCVPGFYL